MNFLKLRQVMSCSYKFKRCEEIKEQNPGLPTCRGNTFALARLENEMNLSPKLPEVADVQESMIELEAAQWNYGRTLRALGRDLDNPLKRADFEAARDDLEEAREVLAQAQSALESRAQEFAVLDAILGKRAERDVHRNRMDELGFGGDDFGVGERGD
jgi:hypothetical protein